MKRTAIAIALLVSLAGSMACATGGGGGWPPYTPKPIPPVVEPQPEPEPQPQPQPEPSKPTGRTGAVRLEGRAFADGAGAWNPLGASLFWAIWGEANDAGRLDQNLAFLAANDFDFVRVLGMVGTDSWSDRVIDPRDPNYWAVVDRLFDRLKRHGLRAEVTIFADAQKMMPDAGERERFVDAWAAYANGRADQVLALEIANESWQNGFESPASVRRLGDRARARSQIPVALSAPTEHGAADLYAGWGSLATIHYDRNISLADGANRPVRQPWGWPGEYFPAGVVVPPAVLNNEPIGPHASVAEDFDPLRLSLAYVVTFVSGNAGYVYHTGAGIRGGGWADQARGRAANVFDYDHTIVRAMQAMKRRLPLGLANWTRHNAQWGSFPWDGSQHAVDNGAIVRFYVATNGAQFVGALVGARSPHTVTARQSFTAELVNPITGQTVGTVSADAGQRATFPADLPGYLVIGTFR